MNEDLIRPDGTKYSSSEQKTPTGILHILKPTEFFNSRIKKLIGLVAALIGFVSSVYGLWPLIFPDSPDHQVKLFPNDQSVVTFNGTSRTFPEVSLLKAGRIVIEGVTVEPPKGALILTNHLLMKNGGRLRGPGFNVVATIIEGGSLEVSGDNGRAGDFQAKRAPMQGADSGSLFVATARIEGTVLRANGGHGGAGAKGADGQPLPPAPSGRDGKCDGFGGYRGADRGRDGGPGQPGGNGQNGAAGGTGGDILLLLSPSSSVPTAQSDRGAGGLKGAGGNGGSGQPGGQGGRGCTGLGGSQPNQSRGNDGPAGPRGSDGENGIEGRDGTFRLRKVRFRKVVETWHARENQPLDALDLLKAITADGDAN